ncbi:DUF6940 family protein [Aliifodinibius salipaludis]|uniref:DUF6940 family protein n=1 Tax=Fodinibius salipaludis TaxID=2032627 RepID=UPI001140DEBA|nr:hypothetical protein [Aliifodinibius salipaludis]
MEKDTSYKYQLYRQERPLSFTKFLELLDQEEEFRQFYIDLLANIPLRAYHWETPPVTKNTVNKPFEFVCSRAPRIDLPPDPGPFRQYFEAGKEVAVFDNLGGDAKLIAPTPTDKQLNYSHIGVFTENAPKEQQLALWQTVGGITKTLISNQPIWLNTAGGGVAWLHVRLDSNPKYYRHHPYASTA